MSQRSRPSPSSRAKIRGRGGRIPPWLFYLVVSLAALGALALIVWAALNPAVPEKWP